VKTARDGALATAMHFLTGVTIAPGLELKLADITLRKNGEMPPRVAWSLTGGFERTRP